MAGQGERGQSTSTILRGGKGGTILRPTPPRRHTWPRDKIGMVTTGPHCRFGECPVWPGHKARSSLLDVERARSSEGFVVLVDVDLYVDIMIKKGLFTLEDNIKGLQY